MQNTTVEDEGVADVYRPMQLDQKDNYSLPMEATVTKDVLPNGTLPTFEVEDLEKLVPTPVDGGARKSAGDVKVVVPMGYKAAPSGKVGTGKRKRGRKPGLSVLKAKKSDEEEDVCFICFDGGSLVLCDRKFCPKAYHPTCVHRDDAFFKKKGLWYCGWHLCSMCPKAAHFLCCTCTYSLCKDCIRKSDFLCVRANKGLCVNCMKLVMLIENRNTSTADVVAVFDDKANWEYLFKEYWLDVKRRLSLTSAEIANANNPWRGSSAPDLAMPSNRALCNPTNGENNSSGNVSEHPDKSKSSLYRQKKSKTNGLNAGPSRLMPDRISKEGASGPTDSDQWASKDLLNFVEHVKGGKTRLSVFDVQSLLIDYVTKYKLRDPNKKSRIICDARLRNLFGKDHVGHVEMLKLLESHILTKESCNQVHIIQGGNEVDEITNLHLDDKKDESKKRTEESTKQENRNDYAAVDVHNINLIYLRRNLVEGFLDDPDKFQEKMIGSFVRIRIAGVGKKQDMYRLVKVIGTSQAAKVYKTGTRSTNAMLEILNINKTEAITIDSISNQEFSKADVQEKAKILQHVKVNDWFETEISRLSHLRDRASEQGQRKEQKFMIDGTKSNGSLAKRSNSKTPAQVKGFNRATTRTIKPFPTLVRECVEKLQILSDPDGRARKLQELPEVHVDSHMDPNYESEENEDDRGDNNVPPRNLHCKRGFGAAYPKSSGGGWDGSQQNSCISWKRNESSSLQGETRSDRSKQSVGDKVLNQSKGSYSQHGVPQNETKTWNRGSDLLASGSSQEIPPMCHTLEVTAPASISETDKIWHYCDPTGKIQGPFSMVQLRKWNTTGYFPADLRIWSTSERQDDSVLLNDVLARKLLRVQGSYASKNERADNGYHDLRTRSGITDTWTSGMQGDENSSLKASSGDGAEITRGDLGTKSTGWESSPMGTMELKQGILASESSGGSKPLSNQHLEQNSETRFGVTSARWGQQCSTESISGTSVLSSVVEPSGTKTATQAPNEPIGSVPASTQAEVKALQIHKENSSEKQMESASLDDETPAMERDVAMGSANDCSEPPIPTSKPADAGVSKDGASEIQMSALQIHGEPVSPSNNSHQQSPAHKKSRRDGVSESKTPPARVSDKGIKTLEQPSPLTKNRLKYDASLSKTSSPELSLQPSSPLGNSGKQHSESKTVGPQVCVEEIDPENILQGRSCVVEAQISPLATDGQLSTSGTTSVTEPNHALTTLDSTPFIGAVDNGQKPGINFSVSSSEPVVSGICDANKNHDVDLNLAETVSSVGSGASNQSQLPTKNPVDTPDEEVHNGSHDNGVCDVISVRVHDSVENVPLDGTTVEHIKHEVDSRDAISSVTDLADVAPKDEEKGSPFPMLEPLETTNALLANEDPATRLFNPMNDLAAHLIPVDDIWDALGPDDDQSGCNFSPDEVIIMEKVRDSGAISLEDDDLIWPEGHQPVSVVSPLPPNGRTFDPGLGGNASVSGAPSTTVISPTRSSELLSRSVASILPIQEESPVVISGQGILQQPVGLLQSSQLNRAGEEASIDHERKAGEEPGPIVEPVPPNRSGQSSDHLVISNPCSEYNEDVRVTTAMAGASGVHPPVSSNAVQGVQDASVTCSSRPLLVPAEEQTPTASARDTSPIYPNARSFNTSTKDSSVSIFSKSSGSLGRAISPPANVAQSSPDSWCASNKLNRDNNFGLPPPAAPGNVSSVRSTTVHETGKMATTSQGWGASANRPATSTGHRGLSSSDEKWRYNGGNESPRSRAGQAQSTGSSRTGWNLQAGNTNARLGVQSGNQRKEWEQHTRDGDRHSSYGDRGSYGAHSHGGRSWNHRSNAGGGVLGGGTTGSIGGPRTPRVQKVCKYHENGYCKKGSSCGFLHP